MNRDAFNWNVVIRKDREHSWRHHARNGTLLKEVLGLIDKWAAKEERRSGHRFIYAHQNTILKLCFKGLREEKKAYGLRQLKYIFEDLRAQHIISRYFENGNRWGFALAPHDSLCHVRDGICTLQDRSIALPVVEIPGVPPAYLAVLAALKSAPIVHSTVHRDCTQQCTVTALNSAPSSRIECTEQCTQKCTDESLYLSNFELLSENEKAIWLESREQVGASIPGIRLSLVSDKPYKPSSLCIQDELKRHHEFLERHKQRQEQNQTKAEEQVKSNSNPKSEVLGSFYLEPKTEEPNTGKSKAAAMKSQNRKRAVLSPEEYQKVKQDKELKEHFGANVPVYTEAEVEKITAGERHMSPCQEGNDIIWRTDAERTERGWTVLSVCTIHGGYNCRFGQACWHKA